MRYEYKDENFLAWRSSGESYCSENTYETASRPRKCYDDRLPIMKRLNADLREVIGKSGAAFTLRITGAGLDSSSTSSWLAC